MYIVTMSSEPLLAAEWVLPHKQETTQPDHVVLRAHNGIRTIELRWAEMQRRLLVELADLPRWTESVKQLLHRNNTRAWESRCSLVSMGSPRLNAT